MHKEDRTRGAGKNIRALDRDAGASGAGSRETIDPTTNS